MPPRSNNRASSRSGEASSVRPSTTITIASASSKRHLRLAKDLRRNQRLIIRNHAAGIDDPRLPAHPLDLAIDAVACNPRLIAHDRSPRSRQPIEQRALTHIRPPANGNQRQLPRIGALGLSDHLRSQQLNIAPVVLISRPSMFDDRGVCRPTIPSAGLLELRTPCSHRRSSASLLNGSTSASLGLATASSPAKPYPTAARLVERIFRLRGSTAPVVGVDFGARPFFGRVLACLCFLPNRFLPSLLATECPTFSRAPSRRPGFLR